VLNTSGTQRRDFVSMIKVVEILALFASQEMTTFGSNVLNIGAGASLTVLEMARLIKERCKVVLGFDPKITSAQVKSDDQSYDLSYESLFLTEKYLSENESIVNSEIDRLLKFCKINFT
jgi:UDP-glucose 4-epimerase